MGGYLSGIYALTYPDRISQLVLADPWGVPAPPPGWEERIPMKWRILAKVINSLVVSPLSLLRAAGPLGPPLVMRTRPDLAAKFQRLFENADPSQRNVGVEYIYHINAQRPSSGEAAFRAMLTDFAWAAKPLLYRLPMLDPKVPVTLVYGDVRIIPCLYASLYSQTVSLLQRTRGWILELATNLSNSFCLQPRW